MPVPEVVRRQVLRAGAATSAAIALHALPQTAQARTDLKDASDLPMPPPKAGPCPALDENDPTRMRMERNWRFHLGDVIPPEPADHNATYLSVKAGNAPGAAATDFDDSGWEQIRLPHDWAILQPVRPEANISEGYRPRGIGWYRRTIRLDPADRDKTIELHFDGIATLATVWVNGNEVAHSWSGYSAIVIDLTPFARFGDDLNTIAIRVDARTREGWWYEGAGIYRHAWLVRRASVAIVSDGIHCDPRQRNDGSWDVPVTATLANVEREAAVVTVRSRLLDPEGREVARGEQAISVPVLDHAKAAMHLDAGKPVLWSTDAPVLHAMEVSVWREGKCIDLRRVPIGFRTVRFEPDRGLILNGVPTKIKGVCLHQDHAGVGTALPDSLIGWRLTRLKAMGCNAIRMTHNAPTPELLDWCDRLGFLVMDENRRFNPAPDYLAQLEWMVRRDRNRASVILWSVFNEEPMQGTHAGVEMVRRMVAAVRKLDTSRPITASMNGMFYEPENVSSEVDVMGFNYYQAEYDKFHGLHPSQPIISSEDTSAFETRGAFASDAARHVITSYDTEAASWGATHRESWKAIASRPFVGGGFVWTGFDYHGEPTPYDWPTVSSFFGILDLCGFPKTAFGIRSAQWVDDRPVVWLAPHWTWPGREGQTIEVFIASNVSEVELRLNGKTLGRAPCDRIMGCSFHVPYRPGRLEALAIDDGRVVARMAHETTGPAVALRLTPAWNAMAGDGEDAQPVTIDAVDSAGRHVPTAQHSVTFSVAGVEIIGLGNGDPNSHEAGQGNRRLLFNGLAQVILRADVGAGRIKLTANAEYLHPASLTLPRLGRTPPQQV